MGNITNDEPPHWHRPNGSGHLVHRLPDPRARTDGRPWDQWTVDEQRYAAHLAAHDAQKDPGSIGPLPTDTPVMGAVVALIEHHQRTADKLRKIVIGARQAQAAGAADAQVDALLAGLRDSLGSHATPTSRTRQAER